MTFEDGANAHPIDETTEIVAAYVSNNSLAPADLPALISSVYAALIGTTSGAKVEPEPEPLVPAVSVKKSITDDYIICLEDGKRFKSLKRHLMTHYDLSPEAYRAKWKLPADYPMVAPNYAAARSALAKSMGLGRKAAAAKSAPKARLQRKTAAAAE
jgi:predicted transcriptional regulator